MQDKMSNLMRNREALANKCLKRVYGYAKAACASIQRVTKYLP